VLLISCVINLLRGIQLDCWVEQSKTEATAGRDLEQSSLKSMLQKSNVRSQFRQHPRNGNNFIGISPTIR